MSKKSKIKRSPEDIEYEALSKLSPYSVDGTEECSEGKCIRVFYCRGSSGGDSDGPVDTTTTSGDTASMIEFGMGKTPSDEQMEEFKRACKPSYFRRGDIDVMDTSYRRASELVPRTDTTPPDVIMPGQFATTFELAQYPRIMDEVKRVLCGGLDIGVAAQLYKVNVYGPGGHFNVHRDTPTSPIMFGSLVVCLPHYFEGGELMLGGEGAEGEVIETTEWSPQSGEAIQWIAFFGDVIHKVQPVTFGHRVTLTYRLEYADIIHRTMKHMSPTASVRDILQRAVDKNRHHKGFIFAYCKHMYAQRAEDVYIKNFDEIAKGFDAVAYEAAMSLNIEGTCVCAISKTGLEDEEEYDEISQVELEERERNRPVGRVDYERYYASDTIKQPFAARGRYAYMEREEERTHEEEDMHRGEEVLEGIKIHLGTGNYFFNVAYGSECGNGGVETYVSYKCVAIVIPLNGS